MKRLALRSAGEAVKSLMAVGLLIGLSSDLVGQQDGRIPAVDLKAISHQSEVNSGEPFQVTLLISNGTDESFNNLSLEFRPADVFQLTQVLKQPEEISPHSTVAITASLTLNGSGQKALLVIATLRNKSGVVGSPVVRFASTQPIAVKTYSWAPSEKLMLLGAGGLVTFLSGVISSFLTIRLKSRVDNERRSAEQKLLHQEEEHRVSSELIALLTINRTAVRRKEPIVRDWHKFLSERGVYSAVSRISARGNDLDLPRRLSEIYVDFADYESRINQDRSLVNEKQQKGILHNVDELLKLIEKLEPSTRGQP